MSKAGANQLQRNDSRVAAMKKHGLQALNTREQFAREISLHWDEAKQSFLLIGEALYLAKGKLQHGEFEEMIRNDLPFERTVCHQLRRVYEAVATNRLREEELPAAYSTAYKITTLTDGELERARASQLLRPDLTRAEIMAFKKSLHPNQPVPDLVKVRKLREHYRKLREQMRAMEEELQALGIDPDSIDDEEEDGVGEGEIIEGEAVKVK